MDHKKYCRWAAVITGIQSEITHKNVVTYSIQFNSIKKKVLIPKVGPEGNWVI